MTTNLDPTPTTESIARQYDVPDLREQFEVELAQLAGKGESAVHMRIDALIEKAYRIAPKAAEEAFNSGSTNPRPRTPGARKAWELNALALCLNAAIGNVVDHRHSTGQECKVGFNPAKCPSYTPTHDDVVGMVEEITEALAAADLRTEWISAECTCTEAASRETFGSYTVGCKFHEVMHSFGPTTYSLDTEHGRWIKVVGGKRGLVASKAPFYFGNAHIYTPERHADGSVWSWDRTIECEHEHKDAGAAFRCIEKMARAERDRIDSTRRVATAGTPAKGTIPGTITFRI